ncbi:hypothetical protein [Microbulbifer sp. THAF38]|uniref:hypothetical protein n=1 Tax=Microbulbifer sp. THAF38 TaxID=2587856 RepID=UPI0012678ED2|nr:hypothetical protein [Microbulbifer sp. THAF38]QFT53018.1 hypothetical protein FIU95_00290 [Microbulbifer sp. THAF38]
MRGVMYAALLFAAPVLATPVAAVSACQTEKTQETASTTAGHAQAPGHELMLEEATREQSEVLFQRQMRHLEKMRRKAERDSVRAEKLQQLKNKSGTAG